MIIDVQSISTLARFDTLDQQAKQILISILQESNTTASRISNEVREQIIAQTMGIAKMLSRIAPLNLNDHLRTRAVMYDALCENPYTIRVESNIDQIVSSIEMLDVSDIVENHLRSTIDTAIRQSLQYCSMSERYENVPEAYGETFEWAFHDSTAEQHTWSNLSEWLRVAEGVYWINGKAGSGKSTFMKHITEDSRTRECLKLWAKDTPLCIATFFFWNSGTNDQKSQSGLLRALLLQILTMYPKLTSVVFLTTWTKLYSEAVSNISIDYHFIAPWQLKELKTAFRVLIRQKQVAEKICFLIDGLDELNGDHAEMAELFKEISLFPNIKVILSSRPWVVFQDLLGDSPVLHLQDLTHSDIQYYVQHKFQGNPIF